MKVKARSVQYSIRGVPAEVDRLLRERAARHKKSLNQLVVDELVRSALGKTKKADFSDLVGKWKEDPVFDEILASQRNIDPDVWK